MGREKGGVEEGRTTKGGWRRDERNGQVVVDISACRVWQNHYILLRWNTL